MNKEFTAVLRQSEAKGGWTYVVWPEFGGVLRHPGPGQGEAGDTVTVCLLERLNGPA